MHDAADVLPLIRSLAAKASTPEGLLPGDFKAACNNYEKGMIPRAFDWVRKSGDGNFVVRLPSFNTCCLVLKNFLQPLNLSRILDRLLLRILSYMIPVAKFGYWFLSLVTRAKTLDDAPEFAVSSK